MKINDRSIAALSVATALFTFAVIGTSTMSDDNTLMGSVLDTLFLQMLGKPVPKQTAPTAPVPAIPTTTVSSTASSTSQASSVMRAPVAVPVIPAIDKPTAPRPIQVPRVDLGSINIEIPICGNGTVEVGEMCDNGSRCVGIPNVSCREDADCSQYRLQGIPDSGTCAHFDNNLCNKCQPARCNEVPDECSNPSEYKCTDFDGSIHNVGCCPNSNVYEPEFVSRISADTIICSGRIVSTCGGSATWTVYEIAERSSVALATNDCAADMGHCMKPPRRGSFLVKPCVTSIVSQNGDAITVETNCETLCEWGGGQ